MGCFGCYCIPPPASQRPRKVYNNLVPDVFPLQAPDPNQPVGKAVERKAGKLAEYLTTQPARTAKVSRRLTRRIKQALYNKQYGHVNIAVYTYKSLLAASTKDEAPFSFSYFSKELIEQPDAVINTLLLHPEALIKCYGADLLASYIGSQNQVDHQMKEVLLLVNQACDLACAKGSSEQLKLACLGAVQQFVQLCHQLKTIPTNLDKVERAVLHNLDHQQALGAAQGAAPDGSTVPGLARSILLDFRPFLQDISAVYMVVENMFRYLDQDSHWKQADAVQRLVGLVQDSCSGQPFLLFAALMRHSSAPGLKPDERAVVINLALQQPSVYSLSAFSLALQELPRALAADNHNDTSLRNTAMAAMRKLSSEVGDAGQLCEAISAQLRQHPTPTKTAQLCLECALAAACAIPTFPVAGRTFIGGHAPAQLLQQLAAIITVWGAAANDARMAACELLSAVLPACGAGLRDEKQALGMMDLVLTMAKNVALGTPADVATMDCVLSACVGTKQPELLLHGVRLSKALLLEVVRYAPVEGGAAAAVEREAGTAAERAGTGDEEADRVWAVALLHLLNNFLATLATKANCSNLPQLRFNVPADACTSIKLEGDGAPGARLVSTSPLFAGNARSAEACLRALVAEWPVDQWYGKLLDALCKGSLLQTHYMHNLSNLFFEPFTAHAMPGLPATQQLAAHPPSAAAAAAGGSSHHNRSMPGAPVTGSPSMATELSTKLEAMARNRVMSIRRERLNLQHVMDMLADGEGEGAVGSSEGAPGAAAEGRAAAGAGPAAPGHKAPGVTSHADVALSLADVLDVVSAFDKLPPPQGPGPLELSDLAQRLEAVTG